MEAFFDTDRTESLMKRLKECGVYVAASNHHFDRTPSIEEMVKRMETMDHFGADILKLAVMPKSDEDLMSLLTATVMMKRRTEKPVITMSMGKQEFEPSLRRGVRLSRHICGGHQGLCTGPDPGGKDAQNPAASP